MTKTRKTLLMTLLFAAMIIPLGMIPDADAVRPFSLTVTLNATSYDAGDIIQIYGYTRYTDQLYSPYYIEVTDPSDNLVHNATSPWMSESLIHVLTAGISSDDNTSVWPLSDGNYTARVGVLGGWLHDNMTWSESTFQYHFVDIIKPTITLTGSSTVTVDEGSTYVDAGATASDNYDGDITVSIITNNPVNTDVPRTYTITYDVSDAAGNAAGTVTRTVHINQLLYCGQTMSYYNNIIHGTESADYLVGNRNSPALIFGYGGNDLIKTYGSGHCVYAGDGNDFMLTASDGNTVHGGAGDDSIKMRGTGTVYGEDGNDTIFITSPASGHLIDGGNGIDICIPNKGQTINTTNCEITQ